MTTTFALGTAHKHERKPYHRRFHYFIYTKVSGWYVITSLLHVCCILLYYSLGFAHLKFVRLTF